MTSISDARHTHQQFLVDLESRLSTGQISPAEFTTLCLIPELVKNSASFQRSPLYKAEFSLSPTIEFLRLYNWKGQSDRIRRSLFHWHQGHYPLVLWERIPTPLELLRLQAQGKRVITVFKKASEWQQIHHGKSAWEFTVHDLIHADHFFQDPDRRAGQIAFYQFVLEQWEHGMIHSLRQHCPEQFDYLISDMNSHPQHLYQTLKALCLVARKKENDLNPKLRLPLTEETRFQSDVNHLLGARLLR